MSKRYYLAPIEGSGTINDPYRAKVQDYSGIANFSAIIPTDPTTGKPTSTWALCIVGAGNHAPLLADASLGALPEVPLDIKVNAMPAATQQAMSATVGRFTNASFISTSDGFRNLVRTLGQQLEPTFDENNFDVADRI